MRKGVCDRGRWLERIVVEKERWKGEHSRELELSCGDRWVISPQATPYQINTLISTSTTTTTTMEFYMIWSKRLLYPKTSLLLQIRKKKSPIYSSSSLSSSSIPSAAFTLNVGAWSTPT